MAEIRPFRGLRFDEKIAGNLGDLVAPPYDIIDGAAQDRLYQHSPHNIIRLELGKQLPGDVEHDNRYTRSASCLAEWLRAGVLRVEPAPAMYVYQQRFEHQGKSLSRTGLLAAMRIEEWHKGVVLPHEATMAGPKLDRLQLMRAAEANFSPIFALAEDHQGVLEHSLAQVIAGQPVAAFADGDGEHRLWVVADPDLIGRLRHAVDRETVYIADGHHRYETAMHYRDERRAARSNGEEPWQFVMTLLVPADDPGLLVLPTHRLLNPPIAAAAIRNAVSQFFDLQAHAEPAAMFAALSRYGKETVVFAIAGPTASTFQLAVARDAGEIARQMPPRRAPAWRQLDVSVLHELVLRRIGLPEAAWSDESQVAYTRDQAYALEAVREGRYKMAIFLNPTPVRQVLAVARAREVMPQKSTYFHPKPKTGLVLASLAGEHL